MLERRIPKYPFRKVGVAKKPTHQEWHRMMNAEIKSGPAVENQIPSRVLLDVQKKAAITEIPPYHTTPPRWVLARVARHARISVVCNDLITRLRRAPSKRAFIETQQGFNELGRRRGGGKLLRRIITQELVDEFIAKGGE